MPKIAIKLVVVLMGCLTGLLLAEVGLRLFWSPVNTYYLWPPNESYNLSPRVDLMPGVAPVAKAWVNSQGIRGSEWSQNRDEEYRILTVGGSTTESIFLDQSKNWSSLLEKRLGNTTDGRRVWVGNLGRAGFNTRDHLGFMRLVVDQYDVDAIVMLVGANDMIHSLAQADEYDPQLTLDEERFLNWLEPRFTLSPLSLRHDGRVFYKRMALWWLAKVVVGRPPVHRNIVRDVSGKWLEDVRHDRLLAPKVAELPSLDSRLDEYRRNIEAIATEARHRSLRIVFLTQPSTWKAALPEHEQKLWFGWRPDGQFYATSALADAMSRYNERLITTCERLNVECIDIASHVPGTFEFFYDDVHFTEAGADRCAAALVAALKKSPPFGP